MASTSTNLCSSYKTSSKQSLSRKKPAPAFEKSRDEQDRSHRKREQNRISQKCLRERQLAHSIQLETLAGIMKASTEAGADAGSSHRAALMSNQLALIDDNKALQEALFRMRKKALSLSAALADVADDAIFEQLLQKTAPKRKAKDISKAPSSEVASHLECDLEDNVRDVTDLSSTEERSVEHLRKKHKDMDGMSLSPKVDEIDSTHESSSSSSIQGCNISLPKAPQTEVPVYVTFDSEYVAGNNNCSAEAYTGQFSWTNPMLDMATWGNNSDFLLPYQFVPESPKHPQNPLPKLRVNERDVWKIEEACLWYLIEELDLRGLGATPGFQQSSSCYDSVRAAIAGLEQSQAIIASVAKTAISMICKLSGLTTYLYGVGADQSMEKILIWKLAPSLANRAAISEPFKPTPLQFMRTDYPLSIDFINWPAIRDQLIYKLGTYPLSQMNNDIVANTVIEIPELRAAINVHDFFVTRVFSRVTTALTSSLPDVVFGNLGPNFDDNSISAFKSDAPGATACGTEEVFQSLRQNMQHFKQMQPVSNTSITNRPLSSSSRNPSVFDKHITIAAKQPLSSRWGLDNLGCWKLSKEFAAAYPFLDCTGVVASYPMYSSKTLPDI